MTTRVYLAVAEFLDQPPQPGDLPVERVFVNASEVPEIWVETESPSVPEIGRVASFALARDLEIGFGRVTGTVERKIRK
jgi:hypothetical protein